MRIVDQVSVVSRLAVVLLCAGLAAACSRSQNQGFGVGSYGDGGGGPISPGSSRDFAVNVGDRVFFEDNSSELSGEAQRVLSAQANWLRQYPSYTILLEGHADERGTREYNIALGARRAMSVRTYLAGQGIPAANMRTISYGKERPVATCDDISCWSQNRRVVTVLNSRAGS
jgi:peptidoglycan-associated lipoprotein